MLLPAELKEEVRQRVGNRGMTAFVVEAIRDKLRSDPAPAPRPVMPPVGSLEITRSIDLDGGPTDIGSPVPDPPTDDEIVEALIHGKPDGRVDQMVGDLSGVEKPYSTQITERILAGQGRTMDEPRARVENIREKFGDRLKSASEIEVPEKPSPTPVEVIDGEGAVVRILADDAESPYPSFDPPTVGPDTNESDTNACPNCFSPMIDGVCWTCSI